jgi:hypothetical protein
MRRDTDNEECREKRAVQKAIRFGSEFGNIDYRSRTCRLRADTADCFGARIGVLVKCGLNGRRHDVG